MNPLRSIKRFSSKKIERAIFKILDKQNHNINVERQRKALMETVEYISEKMNDIQSFSSKEDVLKYAINKCRINGLILEFGVFSGYTINMISNCLKSETVYGFDSFQGLPENWRDGFQTGKFIVNKLPVVNKNVKLIKGWFNETLPEFSVNNNQDIAFLHIDCDLYSSTKTIFAHLNGRIKKGTVVVFDEYFNYPGWKDGEFKAFQEFVTENNIEYRYLTYNNQHEQVALIIE